jgi:hypothetical protein
LATPCRPPLADTTHHRSPVIFLNHGFISPLLKENHKQDNPCQTLHQHSHQSYHPLPTQSRLKHQNSTTPARAQFHPKSAIPCPPLYHAPSFKPPSICAHQAPTHCNHHNQIQTHGLTQNPTLPRQFTEPKLEAQLPRRVRSCHREAHFKPPLLTELAPLPLPSN